MIQSHLIIGSEDYYSSVLTKKYQVRVTLLAINNDLGFGFIEALNGEETEIVNYITEMKAYSHLIEMEITHKSPGLYWTRALHKPNINSIYTTILESGNMTQLPIILENGLQSHNVLSPDAQSFRHLLKLLKSRFSVVDLKSSSSIPTSTGLPSLDAILTKKQIQIFVASWEMGYYEIPRKITLEQIAETLGVKRVTAQERLRRAEKRIMQNYYDKSSIH